MIESRIKSVREKFMALYASEREAMFTLPESELGELLHRAEELTSAQEFSVRAAAEIVRRAATMILEEREK
jgi:hypothetical protein